MNMNWLRKKDASQDMAPPAGAEQSAAAQPLEQLLDTLQRYGDVSIHIMRHGHRNDGWVCSIQMRVTATGASFDVRSEFGCPTANAAAAQCLARVEAALRDMGKTA